jgi:hypothetical protein
LLFKQSRYSKNKLGIIGLNSLYLLKENSIINKTKSSIAKTFLFNHTAKKLFYALDYQLQLKLVRINLFITRILSEKKSNLNKTNYIKLKSKSNYNYDAKDEYNNKVTYAGKISLLNINFTSLIKAFEIFKNKIIKQKLGVRRLIPSVMKEKKKMNILKKEVIIWFKRLRCFRIQTNKMYLIKKKIIFKKWIILLIKRKKLQSMRRYYFNKYRNLFKSLILNRIFHKTCIFWRVIILTSFNKWKNDVENVNKLQYQCEIIKNKNIKKLILSNFINIYISTCFYRWKVNKKFIKKLNIMTKYHKNIVSSYLKYSLRKIRKILMKRINNNNLVYKHYINQLLKYGINNWKNNIESDNKKINNALNHIRKNIRRNKIKIYLINNNLIDYRICTKSKNMNEIYNLAVSKYSYHVASKFINNWFEYKLMNKAKKKNMDKYYKRKLKFRYIVYLYQNINQRSIYNAISDQFNKELLIKNFNYLQTKILHTIASREVLIMAIGYNNEYNLRKYIIYWWKNIKFTQLIKLKKKKFDKYFIHRSLEISLVHLKSTLSCSK